MNKKGFTLIEMIGVVIILSIILMIVFPATSRLIKDNDTKKFDYYYDTLLLASESYANSRRDDLGGIDGKGCIDDIILDDLISGNYIKKFDEENVKCGTPSEFNLSTIGIENKDYVDVMIKNNNGKVSASASLICAEGNKVLYSKLIEKKGTCNRYIAEAKESLLDKVKASVTAITDDNETYFLDGSTSNNYIWYSGKLWRIVSYNTKDRTMKLVTDEAISVVTYDMNYSNYSDSNIAIWLNNYFLPTLKNAASYLVDYSWDFTTVSNANKPNGTNTTVSKVGMLNYYEYNKVKGFLNINQDWWLLSRKDNSGAWYVSSANNASSSGVATFMGVRPSVVLKPNLTFISGGDGTRNNPYELVGDSSANPNTALNTRYAGEYVSFAGNLYRIVSVNSKYTRLISVSNLSVGNLIFDDLGIGSYNSGTKIGTFLNTTWVDESMSSVKGKLFAGDFCPMVMTTGTSQTTMCDQENIVYLNVGLPKVGDMFTTGNGYDYWTINNDTSDDPTIDKVLVISGNGNIKSQVTGASSKSGVRPVINLSNSVLITGGNGTENSPYQVK